MNLTRSAPPRPLFACVAPAIVASLLVAGGCATPTTRLGAQYVDPQAPRQVLRGAAVLVVCEAGEPAIKLICESQISGQLARLGARPVTDSSLVNPTPGREPPAGQYLAAAQAAGARAVFSATLTPDDSMAVSAPTLSIGIGGFGGSGGYRGGSGIGGGVGVTLPAGSGAPSSGLAAIGSLIDVPGGRVMWTAKATTPPGADASALVAEAARVLAGSAQQSGLF